LTVAFVLGVGATTANAAGPAVLINWSIDDGATNLVWPSGVDAGEGTFRYQGTVIDKASGIALEYDLTADPYSAIQGNIQLANELPLSIDVSVAVEMPFTPLITEESALSALVTIGLTTGSGGGQISSRPPYLWQALIDDAVAGPSSSLFYDPFFMSGSGMGSSSTQQNFGIPIPIPGPPISDNIGFALNFNLTSFDTASISSTFTALGDALTCFGDINGNGGVEWHDFTMLLNNWGPCPLGPCSADLDESGAVGIVDMLLLLQNWGSCG
jgi:hypothetical protein